MGLAPATLKVYRTGSNRYGSSCDLYGVNKLFPVNEVIMLRFVAYLYKEGLKAGTIKSYLVAVHHMQIALGLGNPHMEHMAQLLFFFFFYATHPPN